jgi:peptidase M50B-like protein
VSRRDDRTELRTLAVALLVTLVLWNVPYVDAVLYPFKLLATWLHELSHVLVILVTGSGFEGVYIYRDTSGQTQPIWAISDAGTAAIAAAGYMGTPLWGAVLLLVTPTARAARWALLVLAALMTVSAFLVVTPTSDGDRFGPHVTLAMAGVLVVCALALPGRWRVLGAHFIAAQACINALLDIRVLLRPTQVVNGMPGHSDAQQMAMATFGTQDAWAIWTWAIVWLVWSLLVLFVAVRISGSRASRSAASAVATTA